MESFAFDTTVANGFLIYLSENYQATVGMYSGALG